MESQVQIVTPGSFRNDLPYPFCPGCGHGAILDHLNRALVELRLDPSQTVIVSDIGCSGLSDQYFRTHAFHGLHGRALTYASGLKLARPELTVIVVMGDGGCGIGGAHLLSAARRNIGVTLLVFNNMNFGMTGGQHSATTPPGAITASTPAGNLERPLDLCASVAANGASYVYRGTSFDKDLWLRIAEAIRTEGFGLLDVWELCTAYYVPMNRYSRTELLATLRRLGFETGLLHRETRPEYAQACRLVAPGLEPAAPISLVPRFASRLDRPFRIVVAGAAGGKVRSSARLLGLGAILSGLQAAQRDDYPVTVKTGHSVSELVLSPRPIDYTGVTRPDALVVASPEGLAKAGRYLERMTATGRVFTTPELAGFPTAASTVVFDSGTARGLGRSTLATALLAAAVRDLELFPLDALRAAARHGVHNEDMLRAIDAGETLTPRT